MYKMIRSYLSPIKRYIFDRDYRESLKNILTYKYLLATKNKIIFYDRFAVHRQFTYETIKELSNNQNEDIVLFVGERRHADYLKKNNKKITSYYVSMNHMYLFRRLSNKIFIIAASGLGGKKNQPQDSVIIHMFHSLVSMHYIYAENVFDDIDVFFAAGPHHIEELERTAKIRNWKSKRFLKVGYPKLDDFSQITSTSIKQSKTILFAPSWMQYNLLKLHGIEIIEKALALNYKIIVRPHPHSFDNDIDIIDKIRGIAKENILCILEDSNINGMSSFQDADVMISDWSGAAYEYAFGLLKPVLFIDTPPKIAKGNTAQIEFLPMENICRSKVGYVTLMDDFEMNLLKMINDPRDWETHIREVRSDYIYNFGVSVLDAANEIVKIKKECTL